MFIGLAMIIFTPPMGNMVSVLQHETCLFSSNISIYSYKLKKHYTGNIWYDWFRETGTAAGDKQTWIVKIDPSDSTFFFESTYWNKGNYLIGPESIDKWAKYSEMELLWCDDDSGGVNKWNVTPSSL